RTDAVVDPEQAPRVGGGGGALGECAGVERGDHLVIVAIEEGGLVAEQDLGGDEAAARRGVAILDDLLEGVHAELGPDASNGVVVLGPCEQPAELIAGELLGEATRRFHPGPWQWWPLEAAVNSLYYDRRPRRRTSRIAGNLARLASMARRT